MAKTRNIVLGQQTSFLAALKKEENKRWVALLKYLWKLIFLTAWGSETDCRFYLHFKN